MKMKVGDRVRFLNPLKDKEPVQEGILKTGTVVEVLSERYVKVLYDIDEEFYKHRRRRLLRAKANGGPYTQVTGIDIEVIP